MKFIDVAAVADLPIAAPMAGLADGQEIVLVRAADRICALQRRCPHRGADLVHGRVMDGVLVCPRHAAALDIVTGQAVDPARRLFLKFRTDAALTFPVNIEGGRVLVSSGVRQGPIADSR